MPLRTWRLKITPENQTMKLTIHHIDKQIRRALRHLFNISNDFASGRISGSAGGRGWGQCGGQVITQNKFEFARGRP